MKLTQCEQGHFYDADKYPDCPYCNTALRQDGQIGRLQDDAPQDAARAAAAPGPVTGWLVAVQGPGRGADLRLGEGRNPLGLAGDGTPATLEENAPLAARQAVLVYDPETGAFTLLPGDSRALCYLNGEALLQAQPLQAGDTLRLGETELQFVPFCGTFRWQGSAKA